MMEDNEVYVLGGKQHRRGKWVKVVLAVAAAIVVVVMIMNNVSEEPPVQGKQLDAVEVLPKNAKAPLFNKTGAMDKFMAWIGDNLEYPEGKETMDAKVVVSFVIATDGHLSDIKIVSQPAEKAFGEEVVSLLNSCPEWEPARLADGKAVAVSYTLPVVFNKVKR